MDRAPVAAGQPRATSARSCGGRDPESAECVHHAIHHVLGENPDADTSRHASLSCDPRAGLDPEPAGGGTVSGCACHVVLKEVVHAGAEIGDDWIFDVDVEGVRRTLDMRGMRHGQDRVRFARPPTWTAYGPRCGVVMSVGITVKATEKDLIFDDQGESGGTFLVACPGRGGSPLVYPDQEIAVRVEERPLGDAMIHRVTFVFDLTTVCEAE